MVITGIALAMLPGLFNGLFATPVKFESRWSWENIGLVEVVVSCLAMPSAGVSFSASGWFRVLGQAPGYGVVAALLLVWLRFWRDLFWQEHPHYTASLLFMPGSSAPQARGSAMGLLRGGSIFLYGAATPRLGALGPSLGWLLSLAVGLVVANLKGVVLREWKGAAPTAVRLVWAGLTILLSAIVLCGASARFPI